MQDPTDSFEWQMRTEEIPMFDRELIDIDEYDQWRDNQNMTYINNNDNL